MEKEKLTIGLQLVRDKDKYRGKTQSYDYSIYKGRFHKFIYGEILSTIMNAVRCNVLDEYVSTKDINILREFFTKCNLTEIIEDFVVNQNTINELKELYSNLIMLINMSVNDEKNIKNIIEKFRGQDFYNQLKQNFKMIVDYGLNNYDNFNNIFITLKIANSLSTDYQLHISYECSSIMDICLVSLYLMSSANKYLHICHKCGNMTVGGKLKLYCNTCRAKTISEGNKKNKLENNKEYYKLYYRFYFQANKYNTKEKIDTFNTFVSEWKDLQNNIVVMSEQEKTKAKNDFFAKWEDIKI